ncbi:MAG: hypothetical protein QOK42_2358 [Frankiaceae bacterium]|nr:hypothetical protein [Frankiaceae bacterium]
MHLRAGRLLLAAGLVAVALVADNAAAAHRGAPAFMTSSTQLGPLRQNPRVAIVPGALPGRDNASSVAAGGKSYWFFGDTFINAPLSAVNNSAAVTTDLDGTDGITVLSSNLKTDDPVGAPVAAIAKTARELGFEKQHASTSCAGSRDSYCGSQFAHWPGAAVLDAARHRLLVLTTKICRFGLTGCQTGFTGTVIGGGVTAVDLRTGAVTRLAIKHQEPYFSPEGIDRTLLFPSTTFFGGTAWTEAGFLYSAQACDPYTFGCALARVPLASVDDRATWRFYRGSRGGVPTWSAQSAGAPRILSTGAAGGTIQWAPAMKSYLAIYTVPYASDVVYRTAPHAWGPWSAANRLITTMAPQGEVPNYAAFAHPEYSTDGGLTQYVTYYHSGYGELELVKVRFCPVGTPLCA